jgi:hypothetical protein
MSSGVTFDEDNMNYAPRPTPAGSSYSASQTKYGAPGVSQEFGQPAMVRFLMRHGIGSPKIAQGILVAVVVINLIITFIVIKYLI